MLFIALNCNQHISANLKTYVTNSAQVAEIACFRTPPTLQTPVTQCVAPRDECGIPPLTRREPQGPPGSGNPAESHTGPGLGLTAGGAEKAPYEVRRRGGETSARARGQRAKWGNDHYRSAPHPGCPGVPHRLCLHHQHRRGHVLRQACCGP